MATLSVMTPAAAAAATTTERVAAAAEEKREATGVVSSIGSNSDSRLLCISPQQQQCYSLLYSEEGLPLVVSSGGATVMNHCHPSYISHSSNIHCISGYNTSCISSTFHPSGIPFPYSPSYSTTTTTTAGRVAAAAGRVAAAAGQVAAATVGRNMMWGMNIGKGIISGGSYCDSSYQKNKGISTGTTIVAVIYKDGVVLGADTRTSAGSYVVNRAARKITPIHEKICVCRSGSAADTQALTQIVKLYLQQYAQELPRRSPIAEKIKHEQRVAAAALLLRRQQEDNAYKQQRQQKKREDEDNTTKISQKSELSPPIASTTTPPPSITTTTTDPTHPPPTTTSPPPPTTTTPPPPPTSPPPPPGSPAGDNDGDGSSIIGGERKVVDMKLLIEDACSEPRVRAAGMLFQSLCYEYKDTLTAGLIVAGYDSVEGPQIYSIPLGGALMPMKCTAGGSGSTYISAFMDSKYHPHMNKEEAIDFVKQSVAHAIARDGSSGGMIRIIVVTKAGLEEYCVKGDELPVGL